MAVSRDSRVLFGVAACNNSMYSVSVAMRDVTFHRNTGCMFCGLAQHAYTEIQCVYFVLSHSLSSHRNKGSLSGCVAKRKSSMKYRACIFLSQSLSCHRNTGSLSSCVAECTSPLDYRVYILWCPRTRGSSTSSHETAPYFYRFARRHTSEDADLCDVRF